MPEVARNDMAERDPMNPLTDADGEVRELGDLDFARAKRLSDLPEGLQAKLRRSCGLLKDAHQGADPAHASRPTS